MTTTEKTFQVPLTFKDSSASETTSAKKHDTDEANQAMSELLANEMPEIDEAESTEFAESDDLAVHQAGASDESAMEPIISADIESPYPKSHVVEEFEMMGSDAMAEVAVPPQTASNVSLPAALVDEELLSELAQIPDKMGFKIGDVADLLGVKAYVLRYWETEFDMLKPKKAANNQRYYTKKNVENAFLIRKLLHRDRFSIEGARAALRDLKSVVKKEKDWNQVTTKMQTLEERVDHLLTDLKQLRQLFH